MASLKQHIVLVMGSVGLFFGNRAPNDDIPTELVDITEGGNVLIKAARVFSSRRMPWAKPLNCSLQSARDIWYFLMHIEL